MLSPSIFFLWSVLSLSVFFLFFFPRYLIRDGGGVERALTEYWFEIVSVLDQVKVNKGMCL